MTSEGVCTFQYHTNTYKWSNDFRHKMNVEVRSAQKKLLHQTIPVRGIEPRAAAIIE